MGIPGLFQECLGGTTANQVTDFGKLHQLKDKNSLVDINTGTLIFSCGLIHKIEFEAGNNTPALREFKKRLVIPTSLYNWDYPLMFDGCPPQEKVHEHARRRNKESGVAIISTFVRICTQVCKQCCVPYIVAPSQADMKVCRGNPTAIAMCRDSDELVYRCNKFVIVDSYFKEQRRFIELSIPVTSDIAEKFPIYDGIHIFHWFAAVVGCDLSVDKVGIKGAGRGAFVSALSRFDYELAPEMNTRLFAKALCNEAWLNTWLTYSAKQIEIQLNITSKWFLNDGTYYKNTATFTQCLASKLQLGIELDSNT